MAKTKHDTRLRQGPQKNIDTNEVVRLFDKGMTACAVGRALNIRFPSVRHHLVKAGRDPASNDPRRLTDEAITEIVDLFKRGYPINQIARMQSPTASTIRDILVARGFDPKANVTTASLDQLVCMLESGAPLYRIVKGTGLTRDAIRVRLKNAGYDPDRNETDPETLDNETVHDLLVAHDHGDSVSSLVQEFGCKPKTARYYLKAYGRDPNSNRRPIDVADIRRRRRENESFRSIARYYGISPERVRQLARVDASEPSPTDKDAA